jgi:hypothetical protein
VHLAATGLALAKFDGVSEALEHSYNGSTGLREESVVVAGDEEGDVHGINLGTQGGYGARRDFR